MTAGPLALVGGDELNPGNEPHDRLLVEAAGGGPAFVLVTAAARHRPELAVANAVRWFGDLGLRVEELPAIRRRDVTSSEVAARARDGRFFYLVGGDPGILPSTLAGTPLWGAVEAAWRDGAALAGSSAGAMALAEWVLVRDRRPGDERRRATAGLGLLPGVAVLPHFETFGHRWIASARDALPEATLLGIDERSAAVWRAGTWRALGPGAVTVIRRGERTSVHDGEIDALLSPGPP